MLEIPIKNEPNQNLSVILDGQDCQLGIYKRGNNLYMDVNSNGIDIVSTVIARNLVPIVCIPYTGFKGNLIFIDTKENNDPEYNSLGDRYKLIYLNQDEYAII